MGQAVVTVKFSATEFDNVRAALKVAMAAVRREGNALQEKVEEGSLADRDLMEARERISETQREYRRWEMVLSGSLG